MSVSKVGAAAWGYLVLALVAGYFFLPLLAMGRFAFQTTPVIKLSWENLGENWSVEPIFRALADEKVQQSALLTLGLVTLTILITLGTLLPVATWVEIKRPDLKPLLNAITLLPWVVPPVALVVGVAATFRPLMPWFLSNPLSLSFFYAIWMLPFTYRTIEGQLRMINAATLYQAAQSSGARPTAFFFKILLPNLRTSLAVATLLMIAAVSGEFTFAALLLKQSLPVYLIDLQSEDVRAGYALALLIIIITSLLLASITLWLRKRNLAFNAIGV